MSNYIWNRSATDADTTIAARATTASITSPEKQSWTINATGAGSALTIDQGASVAFNGSTGNDSVIIAGTAEAVTVNGAAGDDTITLTSMAAGATAVLNGGAGVDTITVTTGKAIVDGGAGADVIDVVSTDAVTVKYDTADSLTTVAGNKVTLDASSYSKAIEWDFATGLATVEATFTGAPASALAGVTGVIGTQYADTLTAAAGMTLDGGVGADTLKTAAAGVTFIYDAADTLVQGNASTLDASAQTSGISLYLEDNTVFTGIAAVKGGAGADDIRGTAGVTTIDGGKGNDYIWGGSAVAGNNTLTGGEGNDSFWVGAYEGSDTITYDTVTVNGVTSHNSAEDVVNLYDISAFDIVGEGKLTNDGTDGTINIGVTGNTLTLDNASGKTDAVRHFVSQEGWAFDIVFAGTAGTKVSGTANVTDNLVAVAGGNILDGKGGNDNLYGSVAADTFVYHKGDQVYSMGGADIIDVTSATEGAQVYMTDLLAGATSATSTWTINGSKFADDIRGSENQDTIVGGQGDDNIWGGAKAIADTLTGGIGADTYYYGLDEGNDTITAGDTKYSGNALDTVNFYNVASTDDLSVTFGAADLTIAVTGSEGVNTLTLEGWATADGGINKLTNFIVGGTQYTLSKDADSKAVWTKA